MDKDKELERLWNVYMFLLSPIQDEKKQRWITNRIDKQLQYIQTKIDIFYKPVIKEEKL